jgi:SmpA / OmlA family
VRPRLLTVICLTLLVAVTPAAASAARPTAKPARRHSGGIRLFQSVGRVTLGMTPAKVRHVLGRPSAVDRFHGQVTGYSYFGAVDFSISFDTVQPGDPADSILMNKGRYRTPQGIHLGSSKRQLTHAYPSVSCQGGVCKIYQGVPLNPGTRDTEFIVATNGHVIGIAVEIDYE